MITNGSAVYIFWLKFTLCSQVLAQTCHAFQGEDNICWGCIEWQWPKGIPGQSNFDSRKNLRSRYPDLVFGECIRTVFRFYVFSVSFCYQGHHFTFFQKLAEIYKEKEGKKKEMQLEYAAQSWQTVISVMFSFVSLFYCIFCVAFSVSTPEQPLACSVNIFRVNVWWYTEAIELTLS